MYLPLFNLTNIVIKSISITHPHDIECIITNNPPCIAYKYSIRLPIIGQFSDWDMLALIGKQLQGAFWSEVSNQNV